MAYPTEDDYDEEVASSEGNDDDDESRDSDDLEDEEDDSSSHHVHNHDDLDDRSAGSDDGPDTPVPSEAASEAVIVEAEDADDDEEDVLTATAIVEASGDTDSTKKRKRPGPKPKRKLIESDREEAAADARAMLRQTVKRLPMALGESHVVRSMGRIHTDDSRFSNAHHIYPVGFSCDRYEFSPVHGRILKLRCTVLDGSHVRAKQKELGVDVTAPSGPIFRIVWGAGIDDENDTLADYRYDVDTFSKPLSRDSNLCSEEHHLQPVEGMRVRVKYEQDQWYSGTIVNVDETANGETQIVVHYDDGSTEHAVYPDPDISLFRPGSEDESLENGNLELTEMNGKSVTTIVATSAIEAWGKTLVSLGLLDEVTFDNSLGAMKAAREKNQVEPDLVESAGEDASYNDVEREEETELEILLRRKIKNAKLELEQVQADDQEASVELADARLSCLGPFLCNPFQDKDANYTQQISWLTTVIRKEKAKMGSTGNKKKIVTAIDLLERNDTFFNLDVESLIEGLPGSEMLPNYIFHCFRVGFIPSCISESWQQRSHLRPSRLKEAEKRKPCVEVKPAKQSAVDLEREVKRQRRDDERDSRKRQKDEEVEQKKKARTDERLNRLSVQVDERLFKEACFQREKVVIAMAKSLAREFNRRKKAAELIAMQSVVDDHFIVSPLDDTAQELSPLCQMYDEDVLRCWDFVTSYGEAMIRWGYLEKLPTLNSLQNALDALRTDNRASKSPMSRSEAIVCLTDLCIALCKPLAVSLTRLLFASLIALNPVLQKDFGAAFFAEVRTNATKEESDGPSSSDLLPVNTLTWQEVARLAFLSDALGELGNQKHEIAHLLRGYRSMGHPNSKEAKRLRRTEDFPIATIRQLISQGASSKVINDASKETRVRVLIPCQASAEPPSWLFYLHNIKGLNIKKISLFKSNLEKAISNAKSPDVAKTLCETTLAEMEKALAIVDKVVKATDPTPAEISSCNKARMSVLRLLDKATNEVFSSDLVKEVLHREIPHDALGHKAIEKSEKASGEARVKLGLKRDFVMNEKRYKEICSVREQYMSDALILKEEMEHQDEDADDDDDDDDDDDENGKESMKGKEDSSRGDQVPSTQSSSDEVVVSAQPKKLVAIVVDNGDDIVRQDEPARIGKITPYDDFCGDIPTAPELIRRCLAVLRVLSLTNAAEPFIYPVDPQTNPGYYESILHPMCLREVGKRLNDAAKACLKFEENEHASSFVETSVAQFARNVRLIAQNCSCYPSAGATVIAAGDELLRIFERLLLDWVLAPPSALPPIEDLDDDKCVEFHDSDDDSLVLLCDGCEGKYNMGRLNPPLREVPKGDWFCPRCLSGRCWESLDPRLGKTIVRKSDNTCEDEAWIIERSFFSFADDASGKPSLHFVLRSQNGTTDSLPVEEIDFCLKAQGTFVQPLRCLEALSECPGYSQGPNHGVYENLVPVAANPDISDAAAQAFISSSVFQDTLNTCSSFMLINPENLESSEWSRLLTLLIMKCASSEMINSLASKLEADAAEKMVKLRNETLRVDVNTILPLTNEDEISINVAEAPAKPEEYHDVKPNGDAVAVVVNADAIEVVSNVSLHAEVLKSSLPISVASNSEEFNGPDAVLSEEVQKKHARATAIEEKDKRYKAREDNLVAFTIKNQLRPIAASFEEDNVSLVVDNTLGSRDKGLNFESTRCRDLTCDFCGMTDIALGSPLLRVPNMEEWYDLMPHMARCRRVFLTAEICHSPFNEERKSMWNSKSKGKNFIAVKVRVGGEIISVPDESHFESISDSGLLEFLPRNDEGCQLELSCRQEANLPFLLGSLSAHECCAISAHNARKERVIAEHKANVQISQERDAGILCGRTLSLGRDRRGRSFWKFRADNALFVCDGDESKTWRRYDAPEVIASVIVALGKDPIVDEISRVFPKAVGLLRDRQWAQILMRRQFLTEFATTTAHPIKGADIDGSEEEGDEPYQPGEDVLVESKCGQMLWDAKVLAVSHKDEKVNGYRVRYKGWSSRFDEWVNPFRVVEPIEANVAIRNEMIQELQSGALVVPEKLRNLNSTRFINSSNRARNGATIPDFTEVSKVPPSASSGEQAFALAKAALLMIEAALPRGAIDHTSTGAWRPEIAAEWRKLVLSAQGPYTLMGCVFALEENIDPEWIDPHMTHLLSCLPQRWKAIREATHSSLCLRITMLDQGVHYDTVDMLKYLPKGRKSY